MVLGWKNLPVFVTVVIFVLSVGVLPAHSLTAMSEQSMSAVTAQEGLLIDLHLDLTIDKVALEDGDGAACSGCSGNAGVIQLSGITINDGGSQADLTGLTVDASNNVDLGGTTKGALVIGMPNGKLDISVDKTYLGGTNDSSFGMDINGLDMSNTTIEVGANSAP